MFPKPYDLTNKSVNNHLIKIGEVVVLMSFLETWIDFWIWHLLAATGKAADSQNIGKKVTSQIMYGQKVDLLLTLVQSRYPQKVDLFKKLHKKLHKLGEERNNLIHSQYFILYGNTKEKIRKNTHKINLRYGVNKKDGSIDFSKSFTQMKLRDFTLVINSIRKSYNELTKFFILLDSSNKG